MSDSSHRGAFVFGLMLGAAGGALAALLMTPKSGQEIREQIKDQTAPVQDRLSSATTGVRERTAGVQDRLTSATSGVRERADDMIGVSKDKVTQLTQRGQETADDVAGGATSDTAKTTAPEPHTPPRTSTTGTTPPRATESTTPRAAGAAPTAEPVEQSEPASPGTV